jgi:hypothetical protein
MTEREKQLEDAIVCLLVAIRHFENGEDIDIALSAQRTAENLGIEDLVEEEYAIECGYRVRDLDDVDLDESDFDD